MSLAEEARALSARKAAEVGALSWEDLDAYGVREETVTTSSGDSLRLKTHVFWDMNEWDSMMYIITKVYPESGWRRWWPWWPWGAVEVRGGPPEWEPIPPKPSSQLPE